MRLNAPSVTSSWPTHHKYGWHNTKTTIITWEVINQGRAQIRAFLSFCVNCSRFCRPDVWPSCLHTPTRAPIWLLLMTTLAEAGVTKISLATFTILNPTTRIPNSSSSSCSYLGNREFYNRSAGVKTKTFWIFFNLNKIINKKI